MRLQAVIRREEERDYRQVEEIIRKAFYNVYVPGCMEHYLVHVMRKHPDFIPELDLVIELNGQVIGSIMYTRAWLTDDEGTRKEVLTFGPVAIVPEYQRMGYGKELIEYSLKKSEELGYDTVVIFGNPGNYVGCGFRSCRRYHICLENGSFPAAMLVRELKPGALDGRRWRYRESPVMQINEKEAERFEAGFEYMEKKYQPSQEEFYILSQSFIGQKE